MASYYGKGRSNAFRVKDFGAFAGAAEPFGTVYPEADDRVIVLAHNEAGDFSHYDEETDTERTLADILPDHLRDGEIAILMSVGSMRHQSLSGWSMGVHSSGERVTHSLTDTYGEIDGTWPECDYTEAMS